MQLWPPVASYLGHLGLDLVPELVRDHGQEADNHDPGYRPRDRTGLDGGGIDGERQRWWWLR